MGTRRGGVEVSADVARAIRQLNAAERLNNLEFQERFVLYDSIPDTPRMNRGVLLRKRGLLQETL